MQGFDGALGAQGQAAPEQQGGRQASPEEQAEYNKFVAMGVLMLYDKRFMETAREILEKSPQIVDGMARLGAAIATRIYTGAKKQGQEIPAAVILHGGWELMHEVKEFAVVAGFGDITEEDTENAYYMAADMFRSSLDGTGDLDPEAGQQEFEQMRKQYGDDMFAALASRVQGIQSGGAA